MTWHCFLLWILMDKIFKNYRMPWNVVDEMNCFPICRIVSGFYKATMHNYAFSFSGCWCTYSEWSDRFFNVEQRHGMENNQQQNNRCQKLKWRYVEFILVELESHFTFTYLQNNYYDFFVWVRFSFLPVTCPKRIENTYLQSYYHYFLLANECNRYHVRHF